MADLVATRLVSSIQRSKSAVVAWFGIRSLGAPPLAPCIIGLQHGRRLYTGRARPMTRYVALLPTMQIWMATVAILMIGASSAAFISKAGVPGTKALASLADCPVLDRAARAKVAMLINDDSGAEELRVDEALSQLRRARKFCRTGDSTAARYDYESLSVLQTPQSLVLDRD